MQSHVDVLVTGALKHGDAFAAEWLGEIQWWSSARLTNRGGKKKAITFFLNDREEARRPWVRGPSKI